MGKGPEVEPLATRVMVSYHVFYQGCAVKANMVQAMSACPEELDYLNKSKRHKFPDMDDVKEFGDFVDGMQTLGFDQDEQKMIVQIVCAYLHMGNAKVSAKGEGCQAGTGNKSFEVDSREDSYDARVCQLGKARQ